MAVTSTQLAGMSAAGSVSSAIASYYAGKVTQIGYEMEASARKAQAQQARSQAKANELMLRRKFNKVAGTQAATYSTQGRSFSSGSLRNLMRRDREKLNWDIDFTLKSGEIGAIGIEADALGLQAAGKQAAQMGLTKGLLAIGQGAIDYAKIK